MSSPIVLHLPQASTFIPGDLRSDFHLSDQKFHEALDGITDNALELIISSDSLFLGPYIQY